MGFSHKGDRKVQSKAKNNQGCLRSEHKGVRDLKEGCWWQLHPDEEMKREADSPFLTH